MPNPLPHSAAQARAKLLGRQKALALLQRNNDADGQLLREENDSEELASNEEIAEVLVCLSERERGELEEIDAALTRIADGTWGRCERCGEAIGLQRLSAMPEARACVDCAEPKRRRQPVRTGAASRPRS